MSNRDEADADAGVALGNAVAAVAYGPQGEHRPRRESMAVADARREDEQREEHESYMRELAERRKIAP